MEEVPADLPVLVLEPEPEPVTIAAAPTRRRRAAPAPSLRPGTASTGIRLSLSRSNLPAPPPPPPLVQRPRPPTRGPRWPRDRSRPAGTPHRRVRRGRADLAPLPQTTPTEPRTTSAPTATPAYCGACMQVVRGAGVCPAVTALCVSTNKYQAEREAETQRDARSCRRSPPSSGPLPRPCRLRAAGAVHGRLRLRLPRRAFRRGVAFLLSQGVLMAYCFYALSGGGRETWRTSCPTLPTPGPGRVAEAGLRRVRRHDGAADPGADPGAGVGPAALDPLAGFRRERRPSMQPSRRPAKARKMPSRTKGRTRTWRSRRPRSPALAMLAAQSPGILLFIGMAILWKIVYTPVALTVAALSGASSPPSTRCSGLAPSSAWAPLLAGDADLLVLAFGQWVLGFLLSLSRSWAASWRLRRRLRLPGDRVHAGAGRLQEGAELGWGSMPGPPPAGVGVGGTPRRSARRRPARWRSMAWPGSGAAGGGGAGSTRRAGGTGGRRGGGRSRS